jgi:hypothetical protein
MHLNKGRIQVKPKKVSTLQRRSKFAFAKVWLLAYQTYAQLGT